MRPVPFQGHRDPESKHHSLYVCWEALLCTPSFLSGPRVNHSTVKWQLFPPPGLPLKQHRDYPGTFVSIEEVPENLLSPEQ